MRFRIVMLKAAQREYESLSQVQRDGVDADFKTIEERGIEFVKRRYLRDGLLEIKSGNVRLLFQYREGQIVLVGLIYTKKTQKNTRTAYKTGTTKAQGGVVWNTFMQRMSRDLSAR